MGGAVSESRAKRARVADVIHVAGCHMKATVRHFLPLDVDEPEIGGGSDTGPSPLELVTAGLAACQVVTVAKIAEAMAFSFSALVAHAEADVVFRKSVKTQEYVPRFGAARVVVDMTTEETGGRIEELQMRTEERCPASNLFLDAGLAPDVEWRIRSPKDA